MLVGGACYPIGMQAAIFLDRDDTLIHNSGDLGDPAEVRLIQGAAAAIGSLRGLGYKIVVVTNQGGVARGKYSEADVDAVHERINELVRTTASGASIDRFYYCPYHPQGTVERYCREHPWRKPQPGMLLQAAKDMRLDLGQCWMIGDQMRDVEAGAAAGVRTILVHRNGVAPARSDDGQVEPHFVARSLVEAVRIIAQQRKPEMADEMRLESPVARRPSTPIIRGGDTPSGDDAADSSASDASKPPASTPTVTSSKGPARATRPFRPWGAPGGDEPTPPVRRPTGNASSSRGDAATPPTPVASPTTSPAGMPLTASADTAARDETATEAISTAPPPHVDADTYNTPTASMQVTLRQILQELRNQRGGMHEFTALGYLAIVLQVGAAICLIAAFLMGPHEEGGFYKWLGTAIFVQLTVISVLLFDRE